MEDFNEFEGLNTKKNFSGNNFSNSEYVKNLELLNTEKMNQKTKQHKQCLELENILEDAEKNKEKVIDFSVLSRDIAEGNGFNEEAKTLLNSQIENLNGVSIEEFYEAWKNGMDSFPLLKKILQTDNNSNKKRLMNDAWDKQKDLEKYYNEPSLEDLAGNLFGFIKSKENLVEQIKYWKDLSIKDKLKILTGIVEDWSECYKIQAPKIIALNFGDGIRGIGCKDEIEINLSNTTEFYDVIMVLSHEFTHCLQDYQKTPSGSEIKKSKDNYINVVSFGDKELNEIGLKIYQNSLLEREAFYVGNRLRSLCLRS